MRLFGVKCLVFVSCVACAALSFADEHYLRTVGWALLACWFLLHIIDDMMTMFDEAERERREW